MSTKKRKHSYDDLGRRERQIMDIIYRRGQATAVDVVEDMPDKLSNSTVRTFLRILETKGYVTHTKKNATYIYRITEGSKKAMVRAAHHFINTYFDSSMDAVASFIKTDNDLTVDDLNSLSKLIDQVKKERKK
ncbi:MAG: BlaI/MecI/CopY family transcriptional regulator [Spirochaetia bacterium]